jgi:hypothetical protein
MNVRNRLDYFLAKHIYVIDCIIETIIKYNLMQLNQLKNSGQLSLYEIWRTFTDTMVYIITTLI